MVVLEVATSTPKARGSIAAVLHSPRYNSKNYTINVKAPRSIIGSEALKEITHPRLEPATDLMEELWQFCHATSGFCGRVAIGAGLLSWGLLENKMLLIVAGLLFLPLMPTIVGVGFGVLSREWSLAARASLTLGIGLVLTFAAGAFVGLAATPPVHFNDFSSTPVSVLISTAIGIAAALASTDDAGRRELIRLAAAAQVAILPAWLGLALTIGVQEGSEIVIQRAVTLLLNIVAIAFASFLTFVALGYRRMRL
jgi:uncharacterized membrane protein